MGPFQIRILEIKHTRSRKPSRLNKKKSKEIQERTRVMAYSDTQRLVYTVYFEGHLPKEDAERMALQLFENEGA